MEQAGVKFQSEVSDTEKRALLKNWAARQYHALNSWRNASQANASQVDKKEASQ